MLGGHDAAEGDDDSSDYRRNDSAGIYLDSSESSSFYERQGSQALFKNDDSMEQNAATTAGWNGQIEVVGADGDLLIGMNEKGKKMGHGKMMALDKFKHLLNKEF